MSKINNLILLLSAPPGSGKDEIVKQLKRVFNAQRFAHIEGLLTANYYMFGLDHVYGDENYADADGHIAQLEADKNKPLDELDGLTWRQTKILTSESMQRAYGKTFFCKQNIKRMRARDADVNRPKQEMYAVTDMNDPLQVEEYIAAFPDRCIIIRVHREGTSFGKFPGFEEAYGPYTGRDSRNWLFSDDIPSLDFTNDSDFPSLMLSDLTAFLEPYINFDGMRKYLVDQKDAVALRRVKESLQAPEDYEYTCEQTKSVSPFANPFYYDSPDVNVQKTSVIDKFYQLSVEQQYEFIGVPGNPVIPMLELNRCAPLQAYVSKKLSDFSTHQSVTQYREFVIALRTRVTALRRMKIKINGLDIDLVHKAREAMFVLIEKHIEILENYEAKRDEIVQAELTQIERHDADALRAIAWLERGMPNEEIVFDETCPEQTAEELALFKKTSYRKI